MGDFLKLHSHGKVVIIRIDEIIAAVPSEEGDGSDVFIDGDQGISVDETTDQILEAIEDAASSDRMGL